WQRMGANPASIQTPGANNGAIALLERRVASTAPAHGSAVPLAQPEPMPNRVSSFLGDAANAPSSACGNSPAYRLRIAGRNTGGLRRPAKVRDDQIPIGGDQCSGFSSHCCLPASWPEAWCSATPDRPPPTSIGTP